jgi:hypothetical protein
VTSLEVTGEANKKNEELGKLKIHGGVSPPLQGVE